MEKFYIINQYTMFIEGLYDQNGKLISKVHQVDRSFLVDRSPLEILEDSIKLIGYDLRGAKSTAKWILGEFSMCPVMVNPIQSICVFPDRAITNDKAIWFNPIHIIRTTAHLGKTRVEFSNGQTLDIQRKLSSFNHKLQAAEQLRKLTVEIGSNPTSFIQEPAKKRIILNISSKKRRIKKQKHKDTLK
ncbi:competence protein ComK [Bacillus marasmi]|uniref:competence protein ComK n=1 Tax=Bacillus marasmi TaxID=1926279 RepID=UPI001FE8F866|nr:competence protein ComK [Bacillus marasmi]